MATEQRLIDANQLIARLEKMIDANQLIARLEKMKHNTDAITIDGIIRALKEPSTVDAVEVVHGRWKNKQTNSLFLWRLECSVCGEDYHIPAGYNYCPNCGAKMDGEDEDA